MRILHTGDWHLGRTLLGTDLLEHQAAFLRFLTDVVDERAVDLVVVAGDVYDRAIPPVPAVRLLSHALHELSRRAQVVVVPGNHDSAVRLGFGADLMTGRVRILASVDRLHEPILLADEHGPVAVYGIPFLAPDMVRQTLAPTPDTPLARSHQAVVGAAVDRIRSDLATRGVARSVVIAHAFVAGGAPSESEQDIRVGGVDRVAAATFADFSYVALGHLHGPQQVGESGRIQYAGSPLAFSFGERHQRKSVALVDLGQAGSVTVERIAAPVPRRLVDITTTMAELESGEHGGHADAWARVFVTDPAHPDRMVARVRERLPHALAVVHQPAVRRKETPVVVHPGADPVDVAADFVRFTTGAAATTDERGLLREAYEAARAMEVAR
ncbi:metallophosphoesterase family protein [Curtobacterium ammoniigenes]|uniref:metallophosphoesterase family protein n=1 Tax=Curtobacterium ammoniigenes TaxID=395387 RepID=UPI00082EA272|nr:exonuclease subunit SbcD [Curtobacterium ammoniigenes]